MASQTHWSLQLSWALICWGLCPWLLASRIWQRRRVKASEDRKPCFRVTSSSGLSSRTITDLMPVGCQVFLPAQPFNREFALGALSYLIDTLKGKVQPNKVSWFVWALAPLICNSHNLISQTASERVVFNGIDGWEPTIAGCSALSSLLRIQRTLGLTERQQASL